MKNYPEIIIDILLFKLVLSDKYPYKKSNIDYDIYVIIFNLYYLSYFFIRKKPKKTKLGIGPKIIYRIIMGIETNLYSNPQTVFAIYLYNKINYLFILFVNELILQIILHNYIII